MVIEFTLSTFKTKPSENHTLLGCTSLLKIVNGEPPPRHPQLLIPRVYQVLQNQEHILMELYVVSPFKIIA